MSKMRLALLGLVAAFALSAVSSASASTHAFIIEGTEIAKGEKIETLGNTGAFFQTIEVSILGIQILKTCSEDTGTGTLEAGGRAKGKGEGSGCAFRQITKKGTVEPLSTCKIEKEPLTVESEGELTGRGETVATGTGGEPFAKFGIVKINKEATCVLEAKVEIKGSQRCTIPGAEVEMTIHDVICTPGGSNLTMFGEPAKLYGIGTIRLASGKKWSSN